MKVHMKREMLKNSKGLTLVELMISILILFPMFAIGMQTFIKCIELSDMAKNSTVAVWGVKNKLAEIENTTYTDIYNTYNNATFTITNLGTQNLAKIYVNNASANHLVVTISTSWRERTGRVVGSDANFNGVVNAGEAVDASGYLDSIVKLTTQIYDM